jgi:hypothetical protein
MFNPRRLFVVLGVAATISNGSSYVMTGSNSAVDQGPGSTAPVRPFRLDQMQLGGGLMQEKRDRIKEFLKVYDERRSRSFQQSSWPAQPQ